MGPKVQIVLTTNNSNRKVSSNCAHMMYRFIVNFEENFFNPLGGLKDKSGQRESRGSMYKFVNIKTDSQ